MLLNDQKSDLNEPAAEKILPYRHLRGLVDKILRRRVTESSDIEDISQDVFRRSWQWANKNNKNLTTQEWKRLIAKITFNEINRFYTKKKDILSDDFLPEGDEMTSPDPAILNPQFILEIAEHLRNLSFRQRLSLVLYEGEILPYLKVILSNRIVAELLEIDEGVLNSIESEIPLSEDRIIEIIEHTTKKVCRSSIRDERSKGRKLLRRGLFGS